MTSVEFEAIIEHFWYYAYIIEEFDTFIFLEGPGGLVYLNENSFLRTTK